MTTKELDDAAWRQHPFTWRNNRGGIKTKNGYLCYGIPEPPHGRKEKDDDMKGGDRLGFTEVLITPEMVGKTVAVFTSIEIKAGTDKPKEGQIKWHNFIIKSGGISEIWKDDIIIDVEVK